MWLRIWCDDRLKGLLATRLASASGRLSEVDCRSDDGRNPHLYTGFAGEIDMIRKICLIRGSSLADGLLRHAVSDMTVE